MTRLGVIARADDGGLGNLLSEFCRHLRPEAALLVELPENRGAHKSERVEAHVAEVRPCGNPLSRQDVAWLVARADVIYTAETCYSSALHGECQRAGTRLVLHVMPELFHAGTTADILLNPTTYCAERFPMILPVPVARDRLPFRARVGCSTFLHHVAPAMLDRNGTRLVLDALPYIKTPCTIRLIGLEDTPRTATIGRVRLELVPHSTEYWEQYTDDVDCLLLPRRYAGLAMTAQEGAACGIPTIALQRSSLEYLPGVVSIPAHVQQRARFAGGRFDVLDARPRDLASAIERRVHHGVETLSKEADDFAEAISWGRQLEPYRTLLEL